MFISKPQVSVKNVLDIHDKFNLSSGGIAMLAESRPWQPDVKGALFDREKALTNGWVEQGGPTPLVGIPKTRGVWAKEIYPVHRCDFQTIVIFLMIKVNAKNQITKTEARVSTVSMMGKVEKLCTELFALDEERANEELQAVLQK